MFCLLTVGWIRCFLCLLMRFMVVLVLVVYFYVVGCVGWACVVVLAVLLTCFDL